jgi:uncharacterized protein (TIGR01777 family)
MKVLVTGATGLIGQRLVKALADRGDQIVVLTRNVAGREAQLLATTPGVSVEAWADAGKLVAVVETVDTIVNLAGEPIIGKRWTPEQRQVIHDSRIKATRTLGDAVQRASHKPMTVMNASAVGFYGAHGAERLTEADPAGEDFLANVCRDWEVAASDMKSTSTRVIVARIGVVLAAEGGALEQMVKPFKLFGGGPIGNGSQWVSWIHIDDLIALMLFALDTPKVQGPLNLTAPEALTNRDFSKLLGKVLHRPSWLPVPKFALKLALGEVAETLVTGQRVVPDVAMRLGYQFKHPDCEEALRSLLG